MDKPMSAAEYRANARAFKAKAPTETVTLNSGSVFELRRPDLQGALMTGRIPQSLVSEGLAAWQKTGKVSETDVAKHMGEKEVLDSLVFMREVVSECCVNPRFVEFATQDDEIGASDMLPEDFSEIFTWAMTHAGVEGIDALRSFRAGRERGIVGDQSGSEELQPATVSTSEN